MNNYSKILILILVIGAYFIFFYEKDDKPKDYKDPVACELAKIHFKEKFPDLNKPECQGVSRTDKGFKVDLSYPILDRMKTKTFEFDTTMGVAIPIAY